MARRTLLRPWLAAAVLALAAATPLVAAPTPAAATENVEITVAVRDDGFSQNSIEARVGDYLLFKLDDAAMKTHTLAWEQGQIRHTFSRSPGRSWRRYGPLNEGVLHFYDADEVPGYDVGGPFTGILTVSKASTPPPPPPSTSSTSTTVTAPPPTATTTTTMPPATTTTAPTSVRPFLIPDAPQTTTTTVAPAGIGAGAVKSGGAAASTTNKDKEKDKDKGKAAANETPTTVASSPPAAPPDSVFDVESLTPSPTVVADPSSASDPGDESALNAASVLSLLDRKTDDEDTRLLLIAVATLGLLIAVGGVWWWLDRSSRYDPA